MYVCICDQIWTKGSKAGSFSAQSTASHHSASVTGLALHPTGDYLVSASLDGSWAFLDVATGGTLLRQVYDHSSGEYNASTGLLGCQYHPDGLILATSSVSNLQVLGKDEDEVYADSCVSVVRLWDVREQKHVTQFEEHTKIVRNNAINFSENGYYVATGCDDGCVRLWDLRKLKCIKTIEGK
jgi:pre-mRNA-processing factor 19